MINGVVVGIVVDNVDPDKLGRIKVKFPVDAETGPESHWVRLSSPMAGSKRGLVMLPYFSGERTPIHDTKAKGLIFGLDLTHTRGDVYRALFEGIAFGTRHVLETISAVGHPARAIFAADGGFRSGSARCRSRARP